MRRETGLSSITRASIDHVSTGGRIVPNREDIAHHRNGHFINTFKKLDIYPHMETALSFSLPFTSRRISLSILI